MSSEYIRVTTFADNKFLDVSRRDVTTAAHLKDRISTDLGFPRQTIKLLHSGRELHDSQSVEMCDRVYACIVAQPRPSFVPNPTHCSTISTALSLGDNIAGSDVPARNI
jgi:hypothetical protein